jgi:hypothetical protein
MKQIILFTCKKYYTEDGTINTINANGIVIRSTENWKLVDQDLTGVPTVWSTLGQDNMEAAGKGSEI